MSRSPEIRQPSCVGALIRDGENRVYVQRRSAHRRLLPGAWDIVGGHVEEGETAEAALAREIHEETGWSLRRIEAVIADWEWQHNDLIRRELDYLVEVSGDLRRPRLDPAEHDDYNWVSFRDTDFLRQGLDSENAPLWNIIARAARIRFTRDLRMEPIGVGASDALWGIHRDGIMTFLGHRMTKEDIILNAKHYAAEWDTGAGHWWLFYHRNNQSSSEIIGYGGLSRELLDGRYELMLHCTVPTKGPLPDPAGQIIKAALAFAHNELHAGRVTAYTAPDNTWAHEVLQRIGMRPSTEVHADSQSPERYDISLARGSSYDLEQKVVTGIGQILAVPAD
jgi:8-oxo-dGTP pyrophosphatase MutT (NUDIX family)